MLIDLVTVILGEMSSWAIVVASEARSGTEQLKLRYAVGRTVAAELVAVCGGYPERLLQRLEIVLVSDVRYEF